MTQVGEITTERIIWMSPDTTLEEKNNSFLRRGELLELEDNLHEFSLTSKKIPEWNKEGLESALQTVVYQAHVYAMNKTFAMTREQKITEKDELGYSIFRPYTGNIKEPFELQRKETSTWDLEIRYDSGRLKKRAPLSDITYYDPDYYSQDETTLKMKTIRETLNFIGYNGNVEFLENVKVRNIPRSQKIPTVTSQRYETFRFDGGVFNYGTVDLEEFKNHPFTKDKLDVEIRLNIPSYGLVGYDIAQEFDIVNAKKNKLRLNEISNYGLEIRVSGVHRESISADDFNFYFKELLLEQYAYIEKKFREYYTLHSTVLRNFLADFLGIKGGKIPKIFKKFQINAIWNSEDSLKDEGDKCLALYPNQELDEIPWVADYKFDYTWNNEKFGDFTPSMYLSYFEDVEKMFPAIGKKTVVSCGNFMQGVTGQTCDINLMKQINSTQ